jgi:hypothetical protein
LSGVAYNLAKKKEFWILTNKCENKLKHENEAKQWRSQGGATAPPPNRKKKFSEKG